MPMPPNLNDREYQKFELTSGDEVAVRIVGEVSTTGSAETKPGLSGPLTYFSITVNKWSTGYVQLPTMPNMQAINIYNDTGERLRVLGTDPGTGAFVGMPLEPGSPKSYDAQATVALWVAAEDTDGLSLDVEILEG